MPPPGPLEVSAGPPPTLVRLPALTTGDKPLPINLATALKLADVQPLDIAVASERTEQAAAQLRQAQVLWLPTVYLGADYARHDGQIQDVTGNVAGTSKGALLVGAGPSVVFALSDAIFGALSARQALRARESALQTARNDSLLTVAEAYFNVQQARGDLAGAEDVAQRTADLVRRAEDLARKGEIIPELEVVRARRRPHAPARRCSRRGPAGAWPAPTWPACCGWTPRPWWSRSSRPTSASPSCRRTSRWTT